MREGFCLPAPERIPVDGEPASGDGIRLAIPPNGQLDSVYETQEQYLVRIEGQVLELTLPRFASRDAAGQEVASGLLSEATDVYQPILAEHDSLVSVVVFDMASETPGPASAASVPMGSGAQVYMSNEALYLLQTWYQRTTLEGSNEQTAVLKFDLAQTSGNVDMVAAGTVPGHVIKQFSVDEYGGSLRIATTKWNWGGSGPTGPQNSVYVLHKQSGDALEIVGRLEGLAPGETIYSARFMGETAYAVTFRQVDPLFVIDMSDPTEPEVAGSLKVPGFSNYLQAIDGGCLLGLGRNADEQTGQYQDPQVSLFDVNDLSSPQLVDRYTIETGRTGGLGVFDDHHAIAYFPEYQVLAVAIPEGGDVWEPIGTEFANSLGGSCYQPPKTQVWVFRIDPSADPAADPPGENIQLLGQIEHEGNVRRTVRIGNLLYAVSEDAVSVHEVLNPAVQVAELHFGVEDLGPVDVATLPDLDLTNGPRRFRFQTTHAGLLTLDATGSDVGIDLYDANGTLLTQSSDSRIDRQVEAGETYTMRMHGVTAGELRVVNLVERTGDTVLIRGTDHAQAIELRAGNATVTIDGIRYDFDGQGVRSISIDGDAGNDRVTLTGTAGNDMVELWPGHGTLTSPDLTVTISLSETIVVDGGGGSDTATLYDSDGNDELVQWPEGEMLTGRGFSNKVQGFATAYAHATAGGFDVAKIYDSAGDDELVTKPDFVQISGEGFLKQVDGFDAVHAFSTRGGRDVAHVRLKRQRHLRGQRGGSRHCSGPGSTRERSSSRPYTPTPRAAASTWPSSSIRPATTRSPPTRRRVHCSAQAITSGAKFFDGVHAYATGGGHDVARLLGSSADDIYCAGAGQSASTGPASTTTAPNTSTRSMPRPAPAAATRPC